MKVKKLLRETYWGDEFLVDIDGEEKILKVLSVELDRSFFYHQYSKYRSLKLPNLLLPESFNLSGEKGIFLYPKFEGKNLEDLDTKILEQILYLLRIFLLSNVSVAVLGKDDFLVFEDLLIFMPSFLKEHKGGKDIFVSKDSENRTMDVFALFLESFGVRIPRAQPFFTLEGLGEKPVFLSFPYVHRKEEKAILELLERSEKSPFLVQIVGPQRTGKTKLGNLVADSFREKGFEVYEVTKIDELKTWYGVEGLQDLIASLEDGKNKLVFVDDLKPASDMFVFLKRLSSLSMKTKVLVLATTVEAFDFFDETIELKPFDLEELREFLEKTFKREVSEDAVKLFHSITNGIPGYVVEACKDLIRNGCVELDEKMVRFSYGEGAIFESFLRDFDCEEMREISLLGQKFSEEDLSVLSKITGKDYGGVLKKAVESGLMIPEGGSYRFLLEEFWEYFYKRIPEEKKVAIHTRLFGTLPLERVLILSLVPEERKTLRDVLKLIRKHFWDYRKSVLILEYLETLEKKLEKPYYFIESLKIKLLVRTNLARLRDVKVSFSASKEMVKAFTEPDRVLSEMDFEKMNFLDYRKLCVAIRSLQMSGKVLPGLVEKVQKAVSELKPLNKERRYVQAWLFLNLFHLTSNREHLGKAMKIAEGEGFKDLLVLGYLNLGNLAKTLSLATFYYQLSINVAKEIDANLTFPARSNFLQCLLYEGKIQRFFEELSKLRKEATFYSDHRILAYAYFVEGVFHIYNRDHEIAEKMFLKELEIEEEYGLEKRALRGLAANELMAGNFDRARELLKEDNVAFGRFGFHYLRELALASSDEEFIQVWEKAKNDDRNRFFREEIAFIFVEKLAKLDPSGLEEFLIERERENIENSSNLTLALVYETFYRFYRVVGEDFKAKRNLRKAILLYKSVGMEKVANLLMKRERVTLAGELSPKFLFFGYIDTQKNFEDLMEIFAAKLSETVPYEGLRIEVWEKVSNEIVERFLSGMTREMRMDDHMGLSPFSLCISFPLTRRFELKVSLRTNLSVDEEEAWKLIDELELLGNVLVVVLRERIYRQQSMRDPLTGVFSRWYFMEKLEEEVYRCNRYGSALSILMCDIDDFKKLNDTYGHTTGDSVLAWIGRKLLVSLRKSDYVGRYGGEEFVIALPETSLNEAQIVAEKLRKMLETDTENVYKITMSFGVSEYRRGEEIEETIRRADEALLVAKKLGKNRIVTESAVSPRFC